MRLRLRSGAQAGRLADTLAQQLADDPLFYLYCPDDGCRQKFVRAYFSYYLPRWNRLRSAYISADSAALAALTPQAVLAGAAHGCGAFRLRMAAPGGLQRLRAHNVEVARLMQVLLPVGTPVHNLRVFAPFSAGLPAAVLDEAIGYAQLKNLALTYETMHDRFLDDFLQRGFQVGYRHPVAGSGVMQTVLFADFSAAR